MQNTCCQQPMTINECPETLFDGPHWQWLLVFTVHLCISSNHQGKLVLALTCDIPQVVLNLSLVIICLSSNSSNNYYLGVKQEIFNKSFIHVLLFYFIKKIHIFLKFQLKNLTEKNTLQLHNKNDMLFWQFIERCLFSFLMLVKTLSIFDNKECYKTQKYWKQSTWLDS